MCAVYYNDDLNFNHRINFIFSYLALGSPDKVR